eukprot:scaffold2585_cov368-Prasinococcus_capsulatus_cf.AAC.20
MEGKSHTDCVIEDHLSGGRDPVIERIASVALKRLVHMEWPRTVPELVASAPIEQQAPAGQKRRNTTQALQALRRVTPPRNRRGLCNRKVSDVVILFVLTPDRQKERSEF